MSENVAEMVRLIEAHFRDTRLETGCAAMQPAVRRAFAAVPRDRFVPGNQAPYAHQDSPLPLGHGQTISQPFIVALMTQLLDPQPDHRVLDVGTGSGYQAAILARLVDQVYSIELVPELEAQARQRLTALGADNVSIRQGDGSLGWPEAAPFDGIVVAAAGRRVPDALRQQLRPGGRLVIPVEDSRGRQTLQLITRVNERQFQSRNVLSVRFVPLIAPD